jgi:hypothetical protein
VIVPKLVKAWLNGCEAVGNCPTTHKKQEITLYAFEPTFASGFTDEI